MTAGTESWDDFWAGVTDARTEVIRGVEVRVPSDIPLGFQERVSALDEDSGGPEFEAMVEILFGEGVYGAWVEAGMGAIELLTAVTWGTLQGTGRDVTFREAYEAATDPGKAPAPPNRQARRAASKPQSASTGGRSGLTSSASTASRRSSSRG